MKVILLLVGMVLTCVLSTVTVQAQSQNIEFYSSTYASHLENYRQQSTRVAIALSQYTTLQTLSAQEEAVRTMREFLLVRSDVVLTHMALLEESLQTRKTVNTDWVASVSAKLASEKNELVAHHARADIAIDRIKADQEATWFSRKEKDFVLSTDRAQSLIAIAKVQDAITTLVSVKRAIDTWINSEQISETTRIEKKRGSDELGRTIEASTALLEQAKNIYVEDGEVANYARLRPLIISSYTQVLRGVAYAKELTQ